MSSAPKIISDRSALLALENPIIEQKRPKEEMIKELEKLKEEFKQFQVQINDAYKRISVGDFSKSDMLEKRYSKQADLLLRCFSLRKQIAGEHADSPIIEENVHATMRPRIQAVAASEAERLPIKLSLLDYDIKSLNASTASTNSSVQAVQAVALSSLQALAALFTK